MTENVFKLAYKQLKKDIKAIKKTGDSNERLEKYRALKTKFPKLYGGGKLQKQADSVTDRLYANVTMILGAGAGALVISFIIASFFPLALPAAAAVAVLSAVVVGFASRRFLGYNMLRSDTDLKLKDVKYAIKVGTQKKKVEKAIKSLASKIGEDPVTNERERLLQSFKRGSTPVVAPEKTEESLGALVEGAQVLANKVVKLLSNG